jgi:hypothetical protein
MSLKNEATSEKLGICHAEELKLETRLGTGFATISRAPVCSSTNLFGCGWLITYRSTYALDEYHSLFFLDMIIVVGRPLKPITQSND